MVIREGDFADSQDDKKLLDMAKSKGNEGWNKENLRHDVGGIGWKDCVPVNLSARTKTSFSGLDGRSCHTLSTRFSSTAMTLPFPEPFTFFFNSRTLSAISTLPITMRMQEKGTQRKEEGRESVANEG